MMPDSIPGNRGYFRDSSGSFPAEIAERAEVAPLNELPQLHGCPGA